MSDSIPPEYQAALDEGPPPASTCATCGHISAPPRRDMIAEMRAALPLARDVSAIQARARVAIADADERMRRGEALARLDLAVDLIKSIPLPEPINFIVDGIAEGIRHTIRKLMP
jgi:hypothetical protein